MLFTTEVEYEMDQLDREADYWGPQEARAEIARQETENLDGDGDDYEEEEEEEDEEPGALTPEEQDEVAEQTAPCATCGCPSTISMDALEACPQRCDCHLPF